MKRWDVLGIGSVAVDDLLYLDTFPAPDAKLPVAAEARCGGGLVATGLVAAARLGVQTAFSAVLGDDELSHFSIAELEREGVDCSPVLRRAGARPVHSVILVDNRDGSRTILYSFAGVTPLLAHETPPKLVAACRLLFVDNTNPALAVHLNRLAHALGVPVVADLEILGGDPALTLELAQTVDHLIVGAAFAAATTGEREPARAAAALRRQGDAARPGVVVTAGDQGAWYATAADQQPRHCPACAVKVVDTTGCGDVFHGAYAASIAAGASVERAVIIANAAAGLKATQPGGRQGIPDLPTITRYLETTRQETSA